MLHYKSVKININILGLAKIIINVVMKHHSLLDSIITNRELLFISKFWLSLYYFLSIKRKILTAFYLQINCQTKRQNSRMEAYFWAFVNFKLNNWAQFLLMTQFAYNNAKNASTGRMLFELNC